MYNGNHLSTLDDESFINLLTIVTETNKTHKFRLKHKMDLEFFRSVLSGEKVIEKDSINFERQFFKDAHIEQLCGDAGFFIKEIYIEARNRAERKIDEQ